MALKSRSGPVNGHPSNHRVLATHSRQTMTLNPPGGGARTLDPIPVYLLGLNEAQRSDPLEHVVQSGWRYLIVSDGTASVAYLNTDQDPPKYSGLSLSPVSRKLLRACELAEKELRARDAVFEPRVIDAPALHFSALWLHGPGEPYVPLLGGGDDLKFNADLRARVRTAVEERISQYHANGGGKPGTLWNY